MSDYGRFVFEPVLNLVSGRLAGIEVHRCQSRDQVERVARGAVWGARQLAEFDAGIAISSVLHDTGYDSTVPLHVDVLADTVVLARSRLAQLRTSLQHRSADRPTPPILLEINPALSAAPPDAFADGVAALRADGFGIAFDTVGRGFGLEQIAELAPDLVKIDASLVARLPHVPRARAVVAALCEVCRAVGVRVSAIGVTHPDELAAVRDHGIGWAQGPLLAEPRRRPSHLGILLPVDLMPRIHANQSATQSAARSAGRSPVHTPPAHNPTPSPTPRPPSRPTPTLPLALAAVDTLTQAAVTLHEDVTAETVRQVLADHPHAGSIVLLDTARRPVCFLDRNRFMLAISGPFGRALYAHRPARTLADPPRTLSATTDVRAALAYCLSGDRARSYDDVVLIDDQGVCAGIVRVSDLLQEATGTAA
ncbi:EAL domain-containing protein [Pseudonocardia sp. GCM10023141]|uniref:EAL domain-containing protein n=1 Tax=Pseudonocardia sp. GCM10023141 TaxID=3252653 RepID=UPI003619244B